MKSLEKKYVNSFFIVAFIILVAVNIITYLNIRIHLDDEIVINEALATIRISESLFTKISEAETGRRGFFITSDTEFLNQYNIDVKSVDSIYLKMKSYSNLNEPQKNIIDSIGRLIIIKKAEWEESIVSIENKKKDNKTLANFTTKGNELLEKIRLLIHRFQGEEQKYVNQRLMRSGESASYTMISLITGSAIAYILLVTGVIFLNRNISKRRLIESRLWESRNWFATTLQSIGDGVIVTSNIGDIVYMNRVAEELTGWKEAEAKGLILNHIFNILDEKTGNKHKEISKLAEVSRGKLISGVSLKTKNNKIIPIEYITSKIQNEDNTTLGEVFVFRDISERQKTETELLESKKFIQKIADSIPSVIYLYNLKRRKLMYVNYKVIDLLGYSSQFVMSYEKGFFSKFIHPDDKERLRKVYTNIAYVKDSEIIDYEYRIINSSGIWRSFRSYEVVFSRDSDGTVLELLGTAMDVTERIKLAEEIKKYSGHLEDLVDIRTQELQKTNLMLKKEIEDRVRAERNIIAVEDKFRSLVENSIVGIYIIQDNIYVYTNPKLEEMYGYSPGELIGTDSMERIHPDYKKLVLENMQKRLNNEIDSIQYVFKGMKKNGDIIDVEVRGTKMNYNSGVAIIGSLLDITERNKYEQAIIDQQQFLKTVIDTNPSFVFAKDFDGRFTLVNKAVAENYGTNVNDLIGKTDADFNENIEEVVHFLKDDREVISTRKTKFIAEEEVTNSATGVTKWYQTIKVPLYTKDIDVQVLGVATDITARKNAEELIKKSLYEKELLLKEIHHRVKNNLQIIVSLLKLQSKYMYDERDLELFINSRSRVETMSMLHEKLYKTKDLSNIDLGGYLNDLANNIVKSISTSKDEITLEINNENAPIGIDTAIPCGLIINELLLGMCKYSLEGIKNKTIKMQLKKEDGGIHITVTDNGKGISSSADEDTPDSLGMQLIDMLVKQLDGEVKIGIANGTWFELNFNELRYKERI